MKKQLNKIAALLLTGVVMLSGIPVNSFAAVGTGETRGANRGVGQVALYQDGALSDAYSEGEEEYVAPEKGTFAGDLYWGLKNFDEEVILDSYKIPLEEAKDIFRKVINSNPDLFYVSNLLEWGQDTYCNSCNGYVAQLADGNWYLWDESQGRYVSCNHNTSHTTYLALYSFYPHYIAGESQCKAMVSKFDAAVERALAGIDENMSDLDKALYCHDYIVKANTYDYQNYLHDSLPENWDNPTMPNSSHSAYGALVLNVSVCDGYALAYSYLLQQCGIKTRLVTSDEMGHAWSAVELDGEWYFVDCTGDDPISAYGTEDTSDDGDVYDRVYHDSFLMSEELASKTPYDDGPYRGWAQTDIVADNTQYDDAYWRILLDDEGNLLLDDEGNVVQWGITNEYGYCDEYWYYLDDITYEIMRTKDPTQKGEVYSSFVKNAWITWGGWTINGEPASFGKVSVHTPSKTMYVSDAKCVYTIDLTGDDRTVIPYLPYSGDGDIYGITVIDDYLYYGIANTPNDKEKIYRKKINIGEITMGDTNGDGFVNVTDALLILKFVAQIGDPDFIEAAADVTGNGDGITVTDALQVLKYVAKLIPEL